VPVCWMRYGQIQRVHADTAVTSPDNSCMQRPLNYSGSPTLIYVVMNSIVFSIYPLSLLFFYYFFLYSLVPFPFLSFCVSSCTSIRLFSPFLCCFLFPLHCSYIPMGGPGSSVGIATDYELDGPGSSPGGDENFRPSRPALGPTQPPVQWVLGISRG